MMEGLVRAGEDVVVLWDSKGAVSFHVLSIFSVWEPSFVINKGIRDEEKFIIHMENGV